MKRENYIDSYDKLTVGEYMDLKEVLEGCEGCTDLERQAALLSVLAGMEEDDVLNLPLPEYRKLVKVSDFLKEAPKKKLVAEKYNIGGMELETVLSPEDITAAQFIDYQAYVKDVDKNLVEILSTFLIPEGHIYNDQYDLDDVRRVIRENLKIEDALALSAFFLASYRAWLKATANYLESQIRKMKRKRMLEPEKLAELEKQLAVLRENGVG